MKIITQELSLDSIIADYQLDQVFPADCLPSLQVILYEADDYICQQGESLEQISYFLKGKLKIVHGLANGFDMILNLQEKPGLMGEIELMLGKECVSSVIAVEKSLVVQLPTPIFRQKLLDSPLFLRHMGQALAEKLHYNNRLAPTHIHYSLQERLATHILARSNAEGIFSPKLMQLAESFGVSYRHLQRVITQMVDDGWLIKDKRTYKIAQPDQLEKLAITEGPLN